MKIIIHRGTHQIGGIATEIQSGNSRIVIDMGDELSLDPDFVSAPLNISGVTDYSGSCNAVLFTHYHGDHMGQMTRIREDISLYAGALAKDVMLKTAENKRIVDKELCRRIGAMHTFVGGDVIAFGDIRITAYSVDHSACDSYMFLIEAEGKRVLYTGDFRTHGFRGKVVAKILHLIGRVDVLITEGTTVSRPDVKPMTEYELQQKVKEYTAQYKYVYVLCSSTNLERICALSKAVPDGKYFICDELQHELLKIVEKHWSGYSSLYRNIKRTYYGENILQNARDCGFVMAIRDNRKFRSIIKKFNPDDGIILYSMWDGYRTRQGSKIPELLNLAGRWETLHTSGHATHDDIKLVAKILSPDIIVPMHTDAPDSFTSLFPDGNVVVVHDGEEICL